MPVLVDFNQVCIATLNAEMGRDLATFNEEHVPLLRHMIFNCLQSYRKKFRQEYGELIICTDNRSWRKKVFEFYKAHRERERAANGGNEAWDLIFKTIYQIVNDLEEYFPYRVFSIEGCEADDIIAILCKHYHENTEGTGLFDDKEPVLILSGDRDFIQLQKYENVKQYSPILKKFIKPEKSWWRDKYEHILHGDKGDGVPNFRSPANAVFDNIRQKPIYTKELNEWLKNKEVDLESLGTTDIEKQRISENKLMIDLDQIPETLVKKVNEAFAKQTPGNRSKIRTYFIQNRMRNMIEITDQF